MIGCTNIPIHSKTVDLQKVGPGIQEMSGTNVGTLASPSIDISSLRPSTSQFALTGTGKIGTRYVFSAIDGFNSVYFLVWVSLQPSYLPLDPFTILFSGTWYLHPAWLIFVNVVLVSNGKAQTDLRIPNVPAFIGLPFHSQGALWPTTLPIVFLNPACDTLKKP